jgi:hypothetical protein
MTRSILHNDPELALEDIAAPVSWRCVDCGRNTTGCHTRQQIFDAAQAGRKQLDVRIGVDSEVYTVREAIWKKAWQHIVAFRSAGVSSHGRAPRAPRRGRPFEI